MSHTTQEWIKHCQLQCKACEEELALINKSVRNLRSNLAEVQSLLDIARTPHNRATLRVRLDITISLLETAEEEREEIQRRLDNYIRRLHKAEQRLSSGEDSLG